METSIVIRVAEQRDVPGITVLFDAYRVFYGRTSSPDASGAFLAARLQRDESVVFVAARAMSGDGEEEIVGFTQLYRAFSSLSLGRVIVLNDLFVAPGARCLGVGTRLVDAAVAYARQVGALGVTLETHPDNAAALRLYRAKGFVLHNEYVHLSIACDEGAVPPVSLFKTGELSVRESRE